MIPPTDIPGPGSDSRRNWRLYPALAGEQALADARQHLLRDIAARADATPADTTLGNFPFRIYQALPWQLPAGTTPDAAWRSFLLRSGQVNWVNLNALYAPTGAPVGELVSEGCDGRTLDPSDDFLPPTTDAGSPILPVIIPANTAAFYFWIELVVETPYLTWGTNPADPDNAVRNAWAGWPVPDGIHLLIGSVNTQTPYQPLIRQSLNHDLNNMLSVQGCDAITGDPYTVLIPNALIVA